MIAAPLTKLVRSGTSQKRRDSITVYWADLPGDILQEVLARLEDRYSDVLRFSHVCQSWRYAAEKSLPRQLPLLSHCLPPQNSSLSSPSPSPSPCPLLMVPLKDGSGYGRLFSVAEPMKLVGECSSGMMRGKRLNSASFGWVMLNDKNKQLVLFNPLTSCQIELPPLMYKFHNDLPDRYRHVESIKKAVLTVDPGKDPENWILAAHASRPYNTIGYIKSGDYKWTLISIPDIHGTIHSMDDIEYFKGKLYAVDDKQRVYTCDVSSVVGSKLELTMILEDHPDENSDMPAADHLYMVVSSQEELLLVKRYAVHSIGPYDCRVQTLLVEAYKLEGYEDGSYYWAKHETLRDELLFLGVSDSFCMRASDFPKFKKNSYFTDELELAHTIDRLDGRDSLEYYNTPGTSPFYVVEDPSFNLPWLWIIPSPWN